MNPEVQKIRLRLEEACILDFPGDIGIFLAVHPSLFDAANDAVRGQWFAHRVKIANAIYMQERAFWIMDGTLGPEIKWLP